MKALAALLVVACQQSTPTPTPAPAPPVVPAVVHAFADGFSPAYVGVLAPEPITAGTYAMTLEMSFSAFETPELEISASRHGALVVTLAADGSAHGCIASQGFEGSAGQREYQRDPAKRRPYRQISDARVVALRGRWQITDGLGTLRFEQAGTGSCDATAPSTSNEAVVELQCIATAKTALLPAGALACRSTSPTYNEPFKLGMPFGPTTGARDVDAPRGQQVLLAPGGIAVTWTYQAHDRKPTFKIVPTPVTIDPATYK